jgi:hypothetical protein
VFTHDTKNTSTDVFLVLGSLAIVTAQSTNIQVSDDRRIERCDGSLLERGEEVDRCGGEIERCARRRQKRYRGRSGDLTVSEKELAQEIEQQRAVVGQGGG